MATTSAELVITSKAFKNQEEIPRINTCEGANISPEISWVGVPDGTKVLALIVDDPDAPDPAKPEKIFTHWVVYNIPKTAKGFSEGTKSFPNGTQHGRNDYGKKDYAGPCPPIGKHRYFFKLYALDSEFHFIAPPTSADLQKAMVGHILGQTEIVGLYKKNN